MRLDQIHSAFARLREMLRGHRVRRELDDELRLHIEMEIEHNIARGMSEAEARRVAALAFGGMQRFREETSDARGFVVVDRLVREMRFVVRRMRRAPTFALGVIATLAIGLGASAGIGALVYGVMLRPLPYADPDNLVRVSMSTPGLGTTSTDYSPGTFQYFREQARSFSTIGAYYENDGIAITDGDTPERVTGAMITPSILTVLGPVPAAGRLFRDDDATADTVPVLISYDLWQRRFGGKAEVIDQLIELNRGRRRIVGVLPKNFDFPSPSVSVWYASTANASEAARAGLNDRYLTVIGRLRPGVSTAAAETELRLLTTHIHERFPELSAEAVRASGMTATVQTLRAAIVAPVRAELTLLAIMVGVVLLIATANVATLFLLRADRLRGEVAVARALGASQGAIAQRFVVEGVVVAIAGAVAALPIVALSLSTKFGFTAGEIPRLHEVAMTGGIVAAMFSVAAIVGGLLGVAGVARVGRGSAIESLRAETRSTGGRGWRRAQQGLVALQMALALALLLAAALTGESLMRLRRVDIGFVPTNAATFTAVLPFSGYSRYQITAAFHFRIMESLAAVPGVAGVAAGMQLPLMAGLASTHQRVATDVGAGAVEAATSVNVVSANYFSVMGIPLRAGRAFMSGDLTSPTPAVIIGAALARELFGGRDAVGQELRLADSKRYPAYRVVGVVGDVYGERIPDGVTKALYFPLLADLLPSSTEMARIPYNPSMHYVVRSAASLASLRPAFRGIVASIDPRVPLTHVTTFDALVSDATARARLTMVLLAIAAAATLLLGAVGLYSVIAYAVAGRAPEFAVRLALGATAAEIVALVVREGALLAATGLAVGIALSVGGARFIRGVLYEVSATNPATYVAAAALLLVTALVAMYLPARRAGRTDPARALRG